MKDFIWFGLVCTGGMTLYFLSGTPMEALQTPVIIVGLGYVIKNLEEIKKKGP
jgi:hypothetical protein